MIKEEYSPKLEFFRRVRALSYIERCSNTPHIRAYSVAEHSYYITLYSMIFADMENLRLEKLKSEFFETYDASSVMRKALLHDLEESVVGDILYPVHAGDPIFKKALDEVRTGCVEAQLFKELPNSLRNYYIRLWKIAKDDSLEGKLVACMDKFEILVFAMQEIRMGNRDFWQLYENALEIIRVHYSIPSVNSVIFEIDEFVRIDKERKF